jgi:hypothetical protein
MVSITGLSQVQAQLSGLRGLVTELIPNAVPLPEAAALWAAFDGIERAGAAAKVLLAGRVAESGDWKQQGYPSAAHHLAAVAESSVRSAQATLATGKRLADLPATTAALRTGEVSGSQARVIADAAAVNPEAEDELLGLARRASLAELVETAGRAKAAGDPDPDATYRRIRRNRFLRQHRDSEGAWNLRARGPVDAGAMVAVALEPMIDVLFEEARARGERTPRESLAFDALLELALQAFDDDYEQIDDDPVDEGDGAASQSDLASGSQVGPDDSGRRNDPGGSGPGGSADPQPSADEADIQAHNGADSTTNPAIAESDEPFGPGEWESHDRADRDHDQASGDQRVEGGQSAGSGGHPDPHEGAAGGRSDGPDARVTPSPGPDPDHARHRSGAAGDWAAAAGPEPAHSNSPPNHDRAHSDADPDDHRADSDADPDEAEASCPTCGRPPDGLNRALRRRLRRRSRATTKRRGANPRYTGLIRIDHAALVRGYTEGDEVAEIPGVGPIPVWRATELLGGDANLRLVITKGRDVVNVTHFGRSPNAHQRTALLWAQPECCVEGCGRRVTQFDHREDWVRTHRTRLDELDCLCHYHHQQKTLYGWALVPGTGKRAFVPPDDPRHPNHTSPTNHPSPGARGNDGGHHGQPSGEGGAGPTGRDPVMSGQTARTNDAHPDGTSRDGNTQDVTSHHDKGAAHSQPHGDQAPARPETSSASDRQLALVG